MNKNIIKFLIIILVLISFSIVFLNYPVDGDDSDFIISVDDEIYNVIVGKPSVQIEKYPLVIYHHGAGYLTLEPFELRELAQVFADEGFLFWAPERTPWAPHRALETLYEARAIDESILELAIQHPDVNTSDINVVGFSLGSWVSFENDSKSDLVRTVSLLAFGAPYDDTFLYNYVISLANETDYSEISTEVLVMVSKEDTKVDIGAAETIRRNMLSANKTIYCVQYETGDHLDLAGVKNYTNDLISYLKGDEILTSDFIEIDEEFRSKWESIHETGYW